MTKTKPVLTLKSISHNQRLSEETPAYTAKLFVDGEYFANVRNRGHGGCDEQYALKGHHGGFQKRLQDLEALIAETYPEIKADVGGGRSFTYKQSVETLCHELLWRHADQKRLKCRLSRKVHILDADDKVYTFATRRTDEAVAQIKARYPEATVLNDLPFDEAWKLIEAHTH